MKRQVKLSRREMLKLSGTVAASSLIAAYAPEAAAAKEAVPALKEMMAIKQAAPAKEQLITVLNPQGQPPPLALVPMAPRLDTLDGKTIYVVNVMFPGTDTFLDEMAKALGEKYPKTTFVRKNKTGTYFDDDPKLWTEIKQKGHGMIMGVGH